MSAVNRNAQTSTHDAHVQPTPATTVVLHAVTGAHGGGTGRAETAASAATRRIRAADALALCLLDSAGGV